MKHALPVALLLALALPADATPLQTVATERSETTGFVGVTLPLTANPRPKVSLGLRRSVVGSGGDVSGGELRLTFDPFTPRDVQLRAGLLRGNVDRTGLLGGGWDFGAGEPFATLGVVLPHLSGMADIGLDGLTPRLTLSLDSAGKLATPAPTPFNPCAGLQDQINVQAC